MEDLNKLLKTFHGKTLLAIFPHPDDESYVTGGLLQIAKKFELNTKLICLTKGGDDENSKEKNITEIRADELYKASDILGIDKVYLWDYLNSNLKSSSSSWTKKVKSYLIETKPDIVVTFDYSGVTGHIDHITTCHEILKIVRKLSKKPLLLWRVPDRNEEKYFKENKALMYASEANHILKYGIFQSINKIRAIFSHKSQAKGLGFRLQIVEQLLFDTKELYYKVDLKKTFKHKLLK